jgi:hypothetical protein
MVDGMAGRIQHNDPNGGPFAAAFSGQDALLDANAIDSH